MRHEEQGVSKPKCSVSKSCCLCFLKWLNKLVASIWILFSWETILPKWRISKPGTMLLQVKFHPPPNEVLRPSHSLLSPVSHMGRWDSDTFIHSPNSYTLFSPGTSVILSFVLPWKGPKTTNFYSCSQSSYPPLQEGQTKGPCSTGLAVAALMISVGFGWGAWSASK